MQLLQTFTCSFWIFQFAKELHILSFRNSTEKYQFVCSLSVNICSVSNIDIWSLVTLIIKQICKQTVTISVFWALDALFVAEKSDQISMFDMSNESWSLLQYFFLSFWFTTKLFQQQTKPLEPKRQKSWLFVYKFAWLLESPMIRYQCLTCQMKAGVFFNKFSIILIDNKTFFSNKQSP